jgi:hypothetical protein
MGRQWRKLWQSTTSQETEEGCNNKVKGTFILAKGKMEKGFEPK